MKKHLRYLSYLVRHKYFVLLAGLTTEAPLWRLLLHDWSKFLPIEWPAYVDYFYGEKVRLQKQEWDDSKYWPLAQKYYDAFDRAWLHHQHLNPHHWQHWVLREDSGKVKLLPVPDNFVRELVADWAGAGRAITGKWDVNVWYQRNRENILLNDPDRQFVEELLTRFQ